MCRKCYFFSRIQSKILKKDLNLEVTNDKIKFLNENVSEAEIENTITSPSERQGDFKLYVLSESPFVTLTSDDNNASLSLMFNFQQTKLNRLLLKLTAKLISLF